MNFNTDVLIHDKSSFSLETLKKRLAALGFKNMARLELFVWDLEIFQQIQTILKNKIILKGGAATQFYLPIENQRTSVDIDLICNASKEEITQCIEQIEKLFAGEDKLFKFRLHQPNAPKTQLPLLTYYINIPSVCTDEQLHNGRAGIQEVKVEFFCCGESFKINYLKKPAIFALDTNETYQILALNLLFADKLTTLGPNTIGIQNDRMDEQIKQFYDIATLLEFNLEDFNFEEIRKYFIYRAELEAKHRGINFDLETIRKDIITQLIRLSRIDLDNDKELIDYINNFQSLYLKRSINRSKSEWAVIGKKMLLIFQLNFVGSLAEDTIFSKLINIDRMLDFKHISGEKRGVIIKEIKSNFINQFGKYSDIPIDILKGKNLQRIFWHITSVNNAEEVISWCVKYFN